MNARQISFDSEPSTPTQSFVNHVTKYGDTLVAFYFTRDEKEIGHTIVVYGQPILSNGYYQLHFYDPNCTTEQTMKIAADYSSCIIPHNGTDVVPDTLIYYLDFYSAYSLDIDGDYNEYPYGTATASPDVEYSINNIQESECDNRLVGETWLAVDCYGACSVTNAEGEVLILNRGMPSEPGTLEILDTRMVPFGGVKDNCSVAYYKVKRSDRFIFDAEADEVGFEVIWDGIFQDFTGSGAKQVTFTPDSVLAVGSDMTYTLDISAGLNSGRYLSISGANESSIQYQNSDDSFAVGNAPYSIQLIDTHTDTSLLTSNGDLSGTTRIDLASAVSIFESVEKELIP